MSIDEAIKHCYEVAERKCDDCGEEHLQLAKWLEELQDFKNKADFVEVVCCKECSWSTERTKDNELFQYQCRNTVACGKPRRACDFCSYGERRDT